MSPQVHILTDQLGLAPIIHLVITDLHQIILLVIDHPWLIILVKDQKLQIILLIIDHTWRTILVTDHQLQIILDIDHQCLTIQVIDHQCLISLVIDHRCLINLVTDHLCQTTLLVRDHLICLPTILQVRDHLCQTIYLVTPDLQHQDHHLYRGQDHPRLDLDLPQLTRSQGMCLAMTLQLSEQLTWPGLRPWQLNRGKRLQL